jgi:hypothetical protein
VVAEGLELATGAKFQYGAALGNRLLGRFAQAEGAFVEARRLLSGARETFLSIEAAHEVGRTELWLAELAHAQGDRDLLRAHLAEAHALFTRLGLPRYMERTERLSGEWGAPLTS